MSVYFATCREASAVKIGSSVDPHSRLYEIQVGCPLEILIEAVVPGGVEQERAMHRRFEDDLIRGEWFRLTEMIEAIIAANPAPPPRARPVRKPLTRADRLERQRRAVENAEATLAAHRRAYEYRLKDFPELSEKLTGGDE